MRAFLICPVRGRDPDLYARVVADLEDHGYQVHWPPRDTNQEDDTGYQICTDNRAAIKAADVVCIIWDGQSQGCLFDMGMAFALRKPVYVWRAPPRTEGKSFQNMMRAWEKGAAA